MEKVRLFTSEAKAGIAMAAGIIDATDFTSNFIDNEEALIIVRAAPSKTKDYMEDTKLHKE